jgi:hypothetical protein
MRRVIEVVVRELDLRAASAGTEAPVRSSVSFAPGGGACVIAPGRTPTPSDRQAVSG